MPTLAANLLADAVCKDGWVTVNGRHIFIGSNASAKASSDAWKASKSGNVKEALKAHQTANRLLFEERLNLKASSMEAKSLDAQRNAHLDEIDRLEAQNKPESSDKPSDKPESKLSGSDKKLMDVASKAGSKLYGTSSSGLLLDKTTVERGSVKQYLGGSDEGQVYDTFDFVFKPSTGKAIDVADTKIRASHADVDGKIYVAGANGVFVINSTKGLPK